MEQPTDAELVARSLDDPAAFAGIYERYATTIYRNFTRRVGPGDAESLMAETFRIAFEKRAMFDTARPVARPWLYGIATNLVARHYRTEARRHRAIARLDAAGATTADGSDRVVDAVAASRLLPTVVGAINRLPEAERDALLLHVWERLSYGEVAAALGIPVGTVRSRINRARTKLRELTVVADEQLVHADVFRCRRALRARRRRGRRDHAIDGGHVVRRARLRGSRPRGSSVALPGVAPTHPRAWRNRACVGGSAASATTAASCPNRRMHLLGHLRRARHGRAVPCSP